jgi:hypothetical protein
LEGESDSPNHDMPLAVLRVAGCLGLFDRFLSLQLALLECLKRNSLFSGRLLGVGVLNSNTLFVPNLYIERFLAVTVHRLESGLIVPCISVVLDDSTAK